MDMGQGSKATGVSNKLIRYHESVGLIRPADRTDSHYRDFGDRDARELQFIRRARDMGVPIEEIDHLLSFWRGRDRSGREAEAIAQEHFAYLDARISEMQALAGALRNLAKCCAGDDRPDCPILSDLGDHALEPIVRPVVGRASSTRRLA